MVIIQCNITLNNEIGPNISSLQIKWFHNNNSITNDVISISPTSTVSSFFMTTQNITSVQLSDTGDYECRVGIIGNNLTKNAFTKLCIQGIVIFSLFCFV